MSVKELRAADTIYVKSIIASNFLGLSLFVIMTLPLNAVGYFRFRTADYFCYTFKIYFRPAVTYIFDSKINWNRIVSSLPETWSTKDSIQEAGAETQKINYINAYTANRLEINARKLNLKIKDQFVAVMPGHPNRKTREVAFVKIKKNKDELYIYDTEMIAVLKFNCRQAIEKYI